MTAHLPPPFRAHQIGSRITPAGSGPDFDLDSL